MCISALTLPRQHQIIEAGYLESEESWIKCLGTLQAVYMYICLQPDTKPPKTMELSTSTCEAVTRPIRAGYV
mgnify:CR=1 FL=1